MLERALSQPEIKQLYNEQITLFKIIEKATMFGANRALEQCGKISRFMSKKEAYVQINKSAVNRAIDSGKLRTVKKGGKTSNVYILREDFDKWVIEDELASKPVSKK